MGVTLHQKKDTSVVIHPLLLFKVSGDGSVAMHYVCLMSAFMTSSWCKRPREQSLGRNSTRNAVLFVTVLVHHVCPASLIHSWPL